MGQRTRRGGLVATEFEGLALGDARLNARALSIASSMEEAPAESFPERMGTDAELEGLYRFFANSAVKMDDLLAPHVEKTRVRCAAHPVVRVIHDTTTLRFEGDRQGLGSLGGDANGFFAHVTLAVSADERREPLGVLAITPYILTKRWPSREKTKAERRRECLATPRDEKTSSRWEKSASAVSDGLPPSVQAVHIMDQEADDYALFSRMLDAGHRFVIRGSGGRRLEDKGMSVRETLANEPATLLRTVFVNAREKKDVKGSKLPVRGARNATLSIRRGAVEIMRGRYTQSDAPSVRLNVVHVFEEAPPPGEEPIEWTLFTTEPVDTIEAATDVVDHYRARWVIEEYFKALKTGCAFEKRQLTTYESLLRALGLTAPIAWHLLVLRHLSRSEPNRPASLLFSIEQLLLLQALVAKRKHVLASAPTIREAMLAIAKLGGHIVNNGDPGWLVLGRGFRKFAEAEEVWDLARRSDQS
jgi:hypothetical protein